MKPMLQESSINFCALLDKINDGIYVCDLNGTFIYANYALACIFGFERPADIVGRNFEEFLSPERGEVVINQFQNLMSTGNNSALISTEVIRQDGTTKYIEINPTTFIKDGKLVGNQGIVHKIIKRKQAENNKITYLSTHDSQTGLYYRPFFETEMKRLERERQFPISIVLIYVGNLKNVIDLEKHGAESKLLMRVAQVLFNSYRVDDIIARIGKDAFAILLPNVDENTVDITIKRVRINLSKNNNNNSEPALEFYIGISTTKKGERLNSVLKKAEAIAYLAKKKNEIT